MYRNIYWCTAVAVLLCNPLNALAANDTDLKSITEQIRQLKQSNTELEQRLQQDEAAAVQREQFQPRRVDGAVRHL